MESIIQNQDIKDARIGPYLIGPGDNNINGIVCINLINRPERRQKFIERWKNYPYQFFTAIPHKNPVRGCFESHISCIKYAKEQGWKNVLILEDDAMIVKDLSNVPEFPTGWEMIYLGGLCIHIKDWSQLNNNYVSGHVFACHAYIVNSNLFDEILAKSETSDKPIDAFYSDQIQGHHNTYMVKYPHVVQEAGWSDIDNKEKWNNFHWPVVGERWTTP